jgi:hypothetical protein
MNSERLQRAVIQWECQQHLNKVTSLTDQQDWKQLANCYSEDAILARPSDPDNPIVGRDAILASFKTRPPRTTSHLLGNSIFEIVEPALVKVVSRVWLVAGPPAEAGKAVIADSQLLAGTFIDQLVLVDDRWFTSLRNGSIELKYGKPGSNF